MEQLMMNPLCRNDLSTCREKPVSFQNIYVNDTDWVTLASGATAEPLFWCHLSLFWALLPECCLVFPWMACFLEGTCWNRLIVTNCIDKTALWHGAMKCPHPVLTFRTSLFLKVWCLHLLVVGPNDVDALNFKKKWFMVKSRWRHK